MYAVNIIAQFANLQCHNTGD